MAMPMPLVLIIRWVEGMEGRPGNIGAWQSEILASDPASVKSFVWIFPYLLDFKTHCLCSGSDLHKSGSLNRMKHIIDIFILCVSQLSVTIRFLVINLKEEKFLV